MTQDEIIRMAREAGGEEKNLGWWAMHNEDLERFAALVAAHEREACAKVADRHSTCLNDNANVIAAAIRARSETK